MRKLSFLFFAITFSLTTFAQSDLDKLMQEFETHTKSPDSIKYGKNKAAGKYYSIRGFKMYAEVYGQGAPLLIIHGNGGSIKDFVNQIPYFKKNYKVIVADSRAQGVSMDFGDSLTYEMMADDYAALLDTLKVDSAYVIGWSDGGINALLLAIRHPEKVKKLAATGANLVPDSTAVPQEIWDMVMPDYSALRDKKDKNMMEKASFKLLRLLVTQPHISLSDLKKVKCPALIIGGDNDVIKPSHTMLIAENIPRSYLWILPNSGHSTPIMYSEEFNKVVDRFFMTPYRKVPGQGRFM